MSIINWIKGLFSGENKEKLNIEENLVELTASNGLQEPEMTEITDENIPEAMAEEYADGRDPEEVDE